MALHIFLTSTRQTRPDNTAMVTAIRAAVADPVAVLTSFDGRTAIGKKSTDWTAAQIASAQQIFDSTPAVTPQQQAQRTVDRFPVETRALVLALIDALNTVRAKLPTPLPPITPAQALQAIRDKAGVL
jgi:hypothetical protein